MGIEIGEKWGTKMQNEKVERKKNGFLTWPNMALTNMDKRRPNLVTK